MMGPVNKQPGRRASATGEGAFGDTELGVISPELALVDPAAAAAARTLLPDHPWEVAVERARRALVEDPRPTPPAWAPAGAVPRVGLPAEPEAIRRPRRTRPQRPGAPAVRRLAWMAVWAVMITSLTLLAEVNSPNSPALGSRVAIEVPRLERIPVPSAAM